MADSLRVTCSCGCETWVPAEREGQPVICTVCGNSLVARSIAFESESAAKRSSVDAPFAPEPEHPIIDRLEEVRLRENRARRVFIDSNSSPGEFSGDNCPRCGRELRGEWDRVGTTSGILCYICSNQATDGIPDRLKAQFSPDSSLPRPLRQRELSDAALPPSWRHPRRDRLKLWTTRALAISSACTLFGLTLHYVFFDRHASIGTSNDEAWNILTTFLTPPQFQEHAPWTWTLAHGWMIASSVLPVFIAIYIVVRLDNSIPDKGTLQRFFYIAAMCLPVVAVLSAGAVAGSAFSDEPSLMPFVILVLIIVFGKTLVHLFFDVLEQDLLPALLFVMFVLAFSVLVTPYLNLYLFRLFGIL